MQEAEKNLLGNYANDITVELHKCVDKYTPDKLFYLKAYRSQSLRAVTNTIMDSPAQA